MSTDPITDAFIEAIQGDTHDLGGLLGSDFYCQPVAQRLHFASCEGISQVDVELNFGPHTLTFALNTRDAQATLDSLLASGIEPSLPAPTGWQPPNHPGSDPARTTA